MTGRMHNSLYELIGGESMVRKIVEAFYPIVYQNELIGPLFQSDINEVMQKQYEFLSQFFGGPSLYSDKYGHPVMRARHLPFEITPERADAWLSCMREALTQIEMPEDLKETVLDRLSGPAYHFVNQSSSKEN